MENSAAYIRAVQIITDHIKETHKSIQFPKPRPVQQVSEMLANLLPSQDSTSASASAQSPASHDQIEDPIEPIKPYIFGGTPMCKALKDAAAVFRKSNEDKKVLFILSDGMSADGDPLPIAQELRESGVTIATCFLTSDTIVNAKFLFDSECQFPDQGTQVLLEMSSTMSNTHTPVSYLVDAKWELPPSGESRLFIRANSLDVVNEFCRIVVSHLTDTCDAFVHLLEKLPLATYINQNNADFKPKDQVGGTCYANAVAAAFHLAMHRIVCREGGIPDFYDLRKRIIDEYGVKGANTQSVIAKCCPEYRLQFREVDETGARQAINKRRPVIARFRLFEEGWTKFSNFYRKTPKGILTKSDVTGESLQVWHQWYSELYNGQFKP